MSTPYDFVIKSAMTDTQLDLSADVRCGSITYGGERYTDYGHDIQGTIELQSDKVVIKFACTYCKEVLNEHVLYEIPKSIKKKKCLARMVKGESNVNK